MTSDTALPVEPNDLISRLERAVTLGTSIGVRGKSPHNIYNIADEALTALRALSATRTDLWEPIETAPKDRSEILVWRKGWRYPHNAVWDPNVGEEGSWENPFSPHFMDQPTHWQPLPAPPIITEGE